MVARQTAGKLQQWLCVITALAALLPLARGESGIPFCAPGLMSCGDAGCYSNLLTKCEYGQCARVGLLQSLTSLAHVLGADGEPPGTPASLGRGCPIGYVNACGDAHCGVAELCSAGKCVPALVYPGSNSSVPPTVARALQAGAAPLSVCTAARAAAVCHGDTTPLKAIDCNSIGVASVRGVACLQSKLFNCAVDPLQRNAVHMCRGMAVVKDAAREAFSGAGNVTAAVKAGAGGSSSGAGVTAGNSSSSSSGGGSVGSSTGAAGGGAVGAGSQQPGGPLLQPLFQGLADLVGNVSRNVFNISLPGKGGSAAANGGSPAAAAAAGGGSSLSSFAPFAAFKQQQEAAQASNAALLNAAPAPFRNGAAAPTTHGRVLSSLAAAAAAVVLLAGLAV